MKKPQIIVLGASGFIGKSIVEQFEKEKFLVKAFSSKSLNLLKKSSIENLEKLLSPQTILIIASSIVREHGDTSENMLKNIQMYINLREALKLKSVKKCIFISSGDVYESNNLPITESTSISPKTYYAIGKITCEYLLQSISDERKIPLLILRFPGIFGPSQNIKKYGPSSFICSIKNEGVARVWGDGDEKRDFVYIKDLSYIIFQLAMKDIRGILNIATGQTHTFMEVVELLKLILKKNFSLIKIPRTTRSFNQQFNIQLLKKEIPELKFTDLKQALQESLDKTS